jgi:glyoxylase-like metal-dependent hydrolase (beta-lactamase superfamily II)
MFDAIDLHFQGQPQVIASYVVRGPGGAALVETGPGSTLPQLEAGLQQLGLSWDDITDLLLTHIHLDHAGAAGWIARRSGARVHVHHIGAPHLADPSRLLASAQRIYGDLMGPLWGEFLAVPAEQLHVLHDNDVIEAAGRRFIALDTPGHAYHHMAYLLDGLCFSGDVAGVCLPGFRHIRLPTPPPEFDLPAWKASLARLRELRPDRLLLTHFGPVAAATQVHLQGVEARLDEVMAFIYGRWQAGAALAEMVRDYADWVAQQAAAEGCDPATVQRYEVVVPSFMEIPGLVRYFGKAAGQSSAPSAAHPGSAARC